MKSLINKLKNSKRILIQGSSGAGKSTFARELGKILNIPVFHMDKEFWQPGWNRPDPDDWYRRQLEMYEKESWIIEGGAYKKTLPIRVKKSDFVIYLDYNRVFCLYRCIKRYFMYRGKTRPDLSVGCPERLDLDFVKWIIYEQPNIYGPMAVQAIKENLEHENYMMIRSAKDLRRLQQELSR